MRISIRQNRDRVNGVVADDLPKTPTDIGFRARCQWLDGARMRSTMKRYTVDGREHGKFRQPFVQDTDLPYLLHGQDTAPSPQEHLLAAAASCFTTTLVYQAAADRINLDAGDCIVEGDVDLQAFVHRTGKKQKAVTEIRIVVFIDAAVPEAELDRLVSLARRLSPLVSLLGESTRVSVRRMQG